MRSQARRKEPHRSGDRRTGPHRSVAPLADLHLVFHVTPTRDMPAGPERWALPAILSLALVLRVWGLDFGLPYLEARPDEMEVVSRSIRFLSSPFLFSTSIFVMTIQTVMALDYLRDSK